MKRTVAYILLWILISGLIVSAYAVGSEYTVSMPPDQTVMTGEMVSLPVTVSQSGNASNYNAVDMTFKYDPSLLELSTNSLGGFAIVKTAGTVRIIGYGKDRAVGSAAFNLTFRAMSSGTTTVTLASAKVDASDHAIAADAPNAALLDNTTVIMIGGYPVTLPDGFSGNSTATPGVDYTFSKPNNGKDYSIIVRVNEKRVALRNNGNGTYTIPGQYITGPVVVTAYIKTRPGGGGTTPGGGGQGGGAETSAEMDGLWVIPYVELNGRTVFLVAVAGDPGKDMTYAFDGEPMYYTEKYTSPIAVIGEKVYVCLVIVEPGQTLLQSEAVGRLSAVAAEQTTLVYSLDVNGSGGTDLNDAKMVYDAYNGVYWSFDELPIMRFLNADINLDGMVNVEDAAAIVAHVN